MKEITVSGGWGGVGGEQGPNNIIPTGMLRGVLVSRTTIGSGGGGGGESPFRNSSAVS